MTNTKESVRLQDRRLAAEWRMHMGVAMAIIFLVTNIFVVLIMRITLMSNLEYKNGMYLGVHIPAEHKNDDEVQQLMSTTQRNFKIFNNINIIISIAICGICVFDILIFTLVYIVWITIYSVWVEFIIVIGHRKMYDIKIKNNWIVESQKKIYVDTRLSSGDSHHQVDMRYHWILIAVIVVSFIPVIIIRHADILFGYMVLYFLLSLVLSVILYVFNIYANSKERVVYSSDSDINIAMNSIYKRYMSMGILFMSLLNVLGWVCIVTGYMMHNTLYSIDFIIYCILEIVGSVGVVVFILAGRKKKNEIQLIDNAPLYVDDDEYWKSGFYYNPGDKHIFVKNRLFDTNYGFNYARKGAKIMVTTLSVTIIAALIFTFAVLVPFINVNIKVKLSEDMFVAEGAGYKCSIAVPDIEEVQLLDELPKDSFTRSNGGSTNEYDIGYYKGRTYGKCMLFIWDGYSPVLMVKSHDKTVFVNSKQDGDIQALYDEISSKNN